MASSAEATADDHDLYDALNLDPGASADDVRAAFRDLSRMYHPDKQRQQQERQDLSGTAPATSSGASVAATETAFVRIHQAYRVLGDDMLRSFYDRYGLAGVRLAEGLSDDEEETGAAGVAGGGRGRLALPEDRFKDLETRVINVMRKREELRVQRLLSLNGSFTLAAVAAPGHHGALLRRRYALQYSAVAQTVQICVSENLKLSVGCATHVQSSNGVGASKLMLAATTQLDGQTNLRAGVNVFAADPDFDISVTRSLNEHVAVQQKMSMSKDGKSMSVGVYPWLSKTLRGNLSVSSNSEGEPAMSFGLIKRSSSSGHSLRVYLNMQANGGDVGAQLKYKPTSDFNLKVAPSLSLRGLACMMTCTKALDAGLSKLHWVLRFGSRTCQFRLTFVRCGIRFSFPVELWTEASGPLTAADFAILSAAWAAPPLALRLLHGLGSALYQGIVVRAPQAASEPDLPPSASKATPPAPDPEDDAASAALAQRRLAAREAERARAAEASAHGLIIVRASYGEPRVVAQDARAPGDAPGVIDVTDALMAKVRCSKLHISASPKSSLLGFCNPCRGSETPALRVRYRFGDTEHSRTFGDTEPVILP